MPLKLASFALGKTLLLKILNVSERTGMSVVPRSSDVFAMQKLVVRTPRDGRDINQKRVLYKTRLFPTYTEVCREKVYTAVHFWTVYFKRLTCSRLVSGTTIFKSAGDTAHLCV